MHFRNIQRGRDHGLAPYNDYRVYCGLPRACSWESVPEEFTREAWSRLSRVYSKPSDLDLFSAALMETSVKGQSVFIKLGQSVFMNVGQLVFINKCMPVFST